MQEVTGLSSVLGASILSGHPCLSWSLSSFQKFTWTCEGVNIVSWVKVLFLNCIEGGRVLQSKLILLFISWRCGWKLSAWSLCGLYRCIILFSFPINQTGSSLAMRFSFDIYFTFTVLSLLLSMSCRCGRVVGTDPATQQQPGQLMMGGGPPK